MNALTREAAHELRRLYAECSASGRRLWTIEALAERFGVSESTARRAARGLGAQFRDLPPARAGSETEASARSSLEKMQALLKERTAERMMDEVTEENGDESTER